MVSYAREVFRLDTIPDLEELIAPTKKNGSPPLDPIKVRERKHDAFKDAAATMQDQLLLLDDLLKVSRFGVSFDASSIAWLL